MKVFQYTSLISFARLKEKIQEGKLSAMLLVCQKFLVRCCEQNVLQLNKVFFWGGGTNEGFGLISCL